jgi:hypothetical protein
LRIRAGTKAHKNSFFINIISHDQFLIEKLRLYNKKQKPFTYLFSERPLSESRADCYIIPAEMIHLLFGGRNRPDTWVPVIAYGKADLLMKAFEAGCRDYLKEPWDTTEMEFRIKRIFPAPDNSHILYDQEIRLQDMVCRTDGTEVRLSAQESTLLRLLLKQRGTIVPREVLFYALWGRQPHKTSRVVDMHISALRRKLSLLFPRRKDERFIYSAKGRGYMLI